MVVTPCGLSGLNAALVVEVEPERERERVLTRPLREMEKDANIWVNQKRRRIVMRIRVLTVSFLL